MVIRKSVRAVTQNVSGDVWSVRVDGQSVTGDVKSVKVDVLHVNSDTPGCTFIISVHTGS